MKSKYIKFSRNVDSIVKFLFKTLSNKSNSKKCMLLKLLLLATPLLC